MAKGLYTNSELVDTIINDLNTFLRLQAGGQHLQACAIVTGMAQKLVNLRTTIDNDLKNRDQTIEMLKERLRDCGQEVIEVPAEQYVKEMQNGK